ncbi:MAG: Phosphoadenylyl-sulfate reductase [thioredoxin] (EC / Adenylyl-sulfate reductase [thioredoxin] (EC [uncultured Campylobacterales bacterium]|uniref:Adenosine 5'-phosphosulfate reductase n=1 Tax=uncultured Campylobacterales bacterium TaxID=352960 RepID=A0A6S6SNH4_9BACT|nr:MAG: Phosphoadenylyl-sulfate reductase [thioredoxin] (EC / Adenylyl-sulfate reductase [thioredoxin] (EC [uncultured Campylobacterales bacterium]
MGAEDQVITDMLCNINKDVNIFTLDTGRLNPSTYKLIETTNNRYDIKIKCFFPKNEDVEDMVSNKGMYSFYESIEERKNCCFIRKIEPLKRALKGYRFWITGLRAEQSVTREGLKCVEFDESNKIIKINPLINWSEKDVWDYIKQNNVAYNKLHDEGYPSIGCEPCTRAVDKGADIRSGRWWWEDPTKKECGLHIKE